MSKKVLSITAAALAMAAVTFTSCNKDDDDDNNTTPTQTNQQKVVGVWLRTGEGVDANNNNTLETSEQTGPSEYERTTYNSNGTFTDTVNSGLFSGSFDGTWSVTGDYLNINIPGLGSGSERITQLNTTTMITQDTSEHPSDFTIYTKQ